jgi:hypothetical protein
MSHNSGRARLVAAMVVPAALMVACSADDSQVSPGSGDRPSRSVTTAAETPESSFSVVSSIKSGAVLADPVEWAAEVVSTGDVLIDHVDFLIDGKLRWSESSAPYEFDEGGLFTPWPLGSGRHDLVVRAVAGSGAVEKATASVRVKLRPQAAGLPVGTYHRSVTQADYRRVRAYRDPAHGGFGDLPAAGAWVMKVRPDGVVTLDVDPGTQYDAFYEPYQVSGSDLTLYGPAFWLQPHPDQPSLFCEPEASGTYTWSLEGRALTITAVAHSCADRDTILVGTWQVSPIAGP